jgi:hypothetical protein
MAQGFTRNDTAITIKDSANLDSFSRLRVSNPLTIFSNQFTYDLSPLKFEKITGTAGSITYNSTDRLAEIDTGGSVGDIVYMQSYEHIPYQPGRSQLVFITFNMFPPGSATVGSSRKFVGLSDSSSNGLMFRSDGTNGGADFIIHSTTSSGSQVAAQNSWNLDKLNGTGPSGKTLDLQKPQILIIDFQALYVGRVRFGFDIDGEIVYAHEFLNANTSFQFPYIATANLPIIAGMEDILGASDTMHFICCSVASEGGSEDAQRFGYNFSLDGSKTGLGTGLTYLTSLRPRGTFGPSAIGNRVKFVLDSIDILNTGNNAAYYQIGIGATLNTPTYANYNTNYSAIEYDTVGTSTGAPTIVFESGHVSSGGGVRSVSVSAEIVGKYPITLDASGQPRGLGTLFLYAKSLTNTTDLYYSIKWKEIR